MIILALTVVAAASRLVTIAKTPWEWDEILFTAAVADYDVSVHHPHPPGFPLFIATAKLIALAGVPDFRALQTIVVAAAMLVFPVTFVLGRELRLGFATSVGGALIVTFAPNVWYYGGTAFSDVPGLVIVLGAAVLLLRSIRDPRMYVAGSILTAIAAGFRPQLLLIAAVPFVFASAHLLRARRAPKQIAAGAALLMAIGGASYLGAALASSSVREYVDIVREQQEYVARVDSFRSPTRPPLPSLMRRFFKPTRGGGAADKLIPLIAAIGAAAALLRRRRGVAMLLTMFGPLAVISWLTFDLNAASRYVVAYVPMFAFLAAYGLEVIGGPLGQRWREAATITACAAFAVWFAVSAWPALRRVTREDPPLLQALRSVEDRPGVKVFASPRVVPFADFYLRNADVLELAFEHVGEDGYVVVDALSIEPCARNFIAARGRLEEIARDRYFEASVVPAGGCE